jgi:D-alanine-D-alanine ligase
VSTETSPASFGKVAVLYGGRSAEREISIRSGTGVLAALRRQGVDAHAFDPAERPMDDLRREGFERVFIALHGRYGEDGTVQGALELLGIPYTGSGVMASAIAMDKVRTKQIWIAQGLPTPPYRTISGNTDWNELASALGLPLIVKPAHEGSTLGLTKVTSVQQLPAAWASAAKLDASVLAERFIAGRELTVALLGEGPAARALPVIEIRAPEGNYDYQNKYFTDDTQYLCPAPLPEAVAREVQSLVVAAYRALRCSGWGRADLMLDRDNRPWLLEMNTSPGMTDHSLVPMAAKAEGISYDALVLQVLAAASLKIGVREARA